MEDITNISAKSKRAASRTNVVEDLKNLPSQSMNFTLGQTMQEPQISVSSLLSDQREVESIFHQRDSMIERMRLEAQVAKEALAAREASKEIERLNAQVEMLGLEAAGSVNEALKQRLLIDSLERQVASHLAMSEQAKAHMQEFEAESKATQEHFAKLQAEAAEARSWAEEQVDDATRQAQSDRKVIRELETKMQAMALAHQQQIDEMERKAEADKKAMYELEVCMQAAQVGHGLELEEMKRKVEEERQAKLDVESYLQAMAVTQDEVTQACRRAEAEAADAKLAVEEGKQASIELRVLLEAVSHSHAQQLEEVQRMAEKARVELESVLKVHVLQLEEVQQETERMKAELEASLQNAASCHALQLEAVQQKAEETKADLEASLQAAASRHALQVEEAHRKAEADMQAIKEMETSLQAMSSAQAAAGEARRLAEAEAVDAKLQAEKEKQIVQQLQTSLQAASSAYSKQVEEMQNKSATLITSILQPRRQLMVTSASSSHSPGSIEVGVMADNSSEHPKNEIQAVVMKLLSGFYSGDIPEEEAAKQLAALNCEFQLPESATQLGVSHRLSTEDHDSQSPKPSPACAVTDSSNNFIMADPTKLMRLIQRAAVIKQGSGQELALRGRDGRQPVSFRPSPAPNSGNGDLSGGALTVEVAPLSAGMPRLQALPQLSGGGGTPISGGSSAWTMRLKSLGLGAAPPPAQPSTPSTASSFLPLPGTSSQPEDRRSANMLTQPPAISNQKAESSVTSGEQQAAVAPKPASSKPKFAANKLSSGAADVSKFTNPLWESARPASAEADAPAIDFNMRNLPKMGGKNMVMDMEDEGLSGSRQLGSFMGRR